ncbi:hypothetical protein [Heterosigma akashiwo virus 01]|uniref:Uncharacterized protein n=1 Tax=Heterosigma akashiwo virus 01 TaxID=97195 RepID=A0A1C9C577_HAV01|nr:hypothetical protein D1R72_gp110 [Heterosigma akashiwo virus 01]AOM63441.1 hypothetical protein [Heterosigma akashiwo virus 01]
MFLYILFLCIIWKTVYRCYKSIVSVTNSSNVKTIAKVLTRQISRWSLAATQDKNPMVKLLHANYGAGYLWALKDILTEKQIEKYTGINLKEFEQKIVSIQDEATKRVSSLCPEFIGNDLDVELTNLAGDTT